MSSRSLQIAKQNRSAGAARSGRGGAVLRTAPRRAHDLAKRGEAQGGRGRAAIGQPIRHVKRSGAQTPTSSKKTDVYFKSGEQTLTSSKKKSITKGKLLLSDFPTLKILKELILLKVYRAAWMPRER